eukprot:s2471_g8.t2
MPRPRAGVRQVVLRGDIKELHPQHLRRNKTAECFDFCHSTGSTFNSDDYDVSAKIERTTSRTCPKCRSWNLSTTDAAELWKRAEEELPSRKKKAAIPPSFNSNGGLSMFLKPYLLMAKYYNGSPMQALAFLEVRPTYCPVRLAGGWCGQSFPSLYRSSKLPNGY